jgi:prepilin-type N-terminal cleavage/methylation domain-containing protein
MTRRSGFTLLEVVLVLALLVMLAAMAMPALESWYVDMKVDAGADHLRAKFAEARAHAIEEGRPYRFAVMPGQSNYRIAPDSSDFWGGSPNGTATDGSTDGTAPPLVLEDAMPNSITFNLGSGAAAGAADSNGWVTILTFLPPDGSSDSDKTIRLELDGARPVDVSVRSLTGAVTTRKVPAGESS